MTAPGLHHLVHEVVDNSVDEHLAGHCTRIDVTIHYDNSVTVEDNGRGIPVGIHPIENRPTAELVMTVLHAGGKFGGAGYKVSGGLHGVGVSAVNALSDWLKLEIRRDGKVYYQEYARGIPSTEFKQTGVTDRRGTKITFHPDPTIFKNILEFSFDQLAQKLRELAYLNSGLEIVIHDERTDKTQSSSSSRAASRRTSPISTRTRRAITDVVLAQRRARGRQRRGRDAVERRLLRARHLLHEHDQEPRRRHAPHRVSPGADAHDQQLRDRVQAAQGREGRPVRRGSARGPDRGDLGEGRRSEVLEPGQGQAGLVGGRDRGVARWSARSSAQWLEQHPKEARRSSSARRCSRRRRARRRARRARWCSARARSS